jgi:tRNA threonylcarbamoyladenosine biosynthesis protein TsaE
MAARTITTQSENETAAVGRELAATLCAGDAVLLFGDLGAGKTAFVRGLAEGLGVAGGDVSSPTFTLIQEYRDGRLPLFHVDLYRIEDPREFDELGLDEIANDGVLAVEWAERLPARLQPPRYITVRLEHAGESRRQVTVETINDGA